MEYQLFSRYFSSATDSSLRVVFTHLALLFNSTWMPFRYYRWILHSIKSIHYIPADCFFIFYIHFYDTGESFCIFLSSGMFWLFSYVFSGLFVLKDIRQCQKYVSYLQQLSVQSECFFNFLFFKFSAENKKVLAHHVACPQFWDKSTLTDHHSCHKWSIILVQADHWNHNSIGSFRAVWPNIQSYSCRCTAH